MSSSTRLLEKVFYSSWFMAAVQVISILLWYFPSYLFLLPLFSTGGYPHDCTTEAFNTSTPNSVGYSDMTKYWPNVQQAEGSANYTDFWNHEWTKHGTCTGLSQYDYFSKTLSLIKSFGTPASVTNAVGSTLSASSLRNDFGGSSKVALQCQSGSYLSGAYTCWNQSNGLPTTQRECPADVIAEDTCTASTLTVQSF
jgi:ribonuclease T2